MQWIYFKKIPLRLYELFLPKPFLCHNKGKLLVFITLVDRVNNRLKLNYLEIADKRLTKLLVNYSGRHLLQLSSHHYSSLNLSPILHKIIVYPPYQADANQSLYPRLKSLYTHLPFASDSINIILMPHTLETDKKTAKLILTEAWRVLAPNGHIILLGINPVSLLGLWLSMGKKKSTCHENFYSIQTLCQWIHYLGGEIQHTESFHFRPPLSSKPGLWLFKKLAWLERISPWLIPYMGGIYLIVAQKRVRKLNGLGLVWQFPPVLNDKVLAPQH